MDNTFSAILNKHEADDRCLISKDALFISAIEREFSNSREILTEAEAASITVHDFLSGKIENFPIIPIRKSSNFYIKKHTESQIPYFHSHEFYEFIYVHKGECVQKFDNNHELHLSQKQGCLIAPKTTHLIEKAKKSDIILKAVIPRDLFAKTGKAVCDDAEINGVKVFEFINETAEFTVLKLLETQAKEVDYHFPLLISSYLTILFFELFSAPKSDFALKEILNDYFERNLRTASLNEFARLKNYNPNYIGRVIKAQTGESFSDLLNRYRIAKAKSLLINSDLSVENIAFEVGYTGASGFYKLFFSLCGMTPNEYRSSVK